MMMDNELYPMIFRRKSFHLFRNTGNAVISEKELNQIREAWDSFIPLNPEIHTAIKIVKAKETTCARGEEYCILLYSENKENALMNIGYLGEQLDLYLVSKDIGTLWFGIGKTEEKAYEGMDFVIMIAIHKILDPSKFRKDIFRSKRKPAEEIWEGPEIPGVTDLVRFTPSACNSQPWFVRYEKDLYVYRYRKEGKRGIMPKDRVTYYNRIDLGIFLCFLELCMDHEGIRYDRKLFVDAGGEEEMTLNAVYKIKS